MISSESSGVATHSLGLAVAPSGVAQVLDVAVHVALGEVGVRRDGDAPDRGEVLGARASQAHQTPNVFRG